MERKVALKKLLRILGKNMGYRVDAKGALKEEREAAREQLQPALRIRERIRTERRERYEQILAGDTEYQRLIEEDKRATAETDRLASIMRHYRVTVGKSNGMFFTIEAQGDSWEDVINKLTKKEVGENV